MCRHFVLQWFGGILDVNQCTSLCKCMDVAMIFFRPIMVLQLPDTFLCCKIRISSTRTMDLTETWLNLNMQSLILGNYSAQFCLYIIYRFLSHIVIPISFSCNWEKRFLIFCVHCWMNLHLPHSTFHCIIIIFNFGFSKNWNIHYLICFGFPKIEQPIIWLNYVWFTFVKWCKLQ